MPKTATALVTVNTQGHLMPDSTITVDGQTLPVPEQYGTTLWMHRVGRTLRDHGWRLVLGPTRQAQLDCSKPGVIGVLVTREEG